MLADTRAAIAEIVRVEDQIVNSPTPYQEAARHAIDHASGALGHVEHLLDRRDEPPWVAPLHGVQVNLMAARARLKDALEAREIDDYQILVTQALLNLQAALGRPTRPGVLGGLSGALATTTLGVPAGARLVSACEPAAGAGPAYGVKDGYLAFVSVPAAAGTTALDEDFGSRAISVEGDRLVVRTAAAGLVAARCHGGQGASAPPADADSPPALYTRAQAKAGNRIFVAHCAKCHGADLQGGSAPAIAGNDFLQTAQHNGWTLDAVRYIVTNLMPLHSPGSLSAEQYADLLAFLLAANCYPAGSTPFPQKEDERFKKITLHPLQGAHPRQPKLGTCLPR